MWNTLNLLSQTVSAKSWKNSFCCSNLKLDLASLSSWPDTFFLTGVSYLHLLVDQFRWTGAYTEFWRNYVTAIKVQHNYCHKIYTFLGHISFCFLKHKYQNFVPSHYILILYMFYLIEILFINCWLRNYENSWGDLIAAHTV